jgi:carbamoyl-phosphate synthase large subunit
LIARELHLLGFKLVATQGTAAYLNKAGIPATPINKISEGSPHIIDGLRVGQIQLMVNTARGEQAHQDGGQIRNAAYLYGVPILTTLSAALAAVEGIKSLRKKSLKVRSLQAHHGG